MATGRQLALTLSPRLADTIGEAKRRGLTVDDTVAGRDRRTVGEVGMLIAGLNRAMADAARDGIVVTLTAHYQDDVAPAPKRCIIAGTMHRVAFRARV